MIENKNASPNADERKCAAKVLLSVSADEEPIDLSENITSVNLTREMQIIQPEVYESNPINELSINIEDEAGFFDASDKDNIYYRLSEKTSSKVQLSTVEYGAEHDFLTLCNYQLSQKQISGNKLTFTFYDAMGANTKDEYFYHNVNSSHVTARDIADYSLSRRGFAAHCNISDALNESYVFAPEDFKGSASNLDAYVKFGGGLKKIAYLLDKTSVSGGGKNVVWLFDNDGNIRYKYKNDKDNVSEYLSEQDYISFEITTHEMHTDIPIIKFSDRGNILRELDDVVSITKKSQTFVICIFKIEYSFSGGTLSAVKGAR